MAKTKTFQLPTHPRGGPQKIVVESLDGIWHLVIDKDKAKPLPNLKRTPKTAKEVLDALAGISGEMGVYDFVREGYSRC